MDDLLQHETQQSTEDMFAHVEHEDYVSNGAPSILLLEKVVLHQILTCRITSPFFKHKARKVVRQDNIVKKFAGQSQDDVLQVIDMEQRSGHKQMTPSEMGLLVCGAESHSSCRFGVQEGNLNPYARSRSCIPWHSDNEPLFGPQNLSKLIVSLSLGNSVEFMVRRRASGNVPSSIRLDHGNVLVMDGPAQPEYAYRTVPGLQGHRVNLTYRWVAQHTASCPLAGAVGCALPTCAQGLADPGPRVGSFGEPNWTMFW